MPRGRPKIVRGYSLDPILVKEIKRRANAELRSDSDLVEVTLCMAFGVELPE